MKVPAAPDATPRREQWPSLLRELAAQLDTGRIYTRDLPELGTVLTAALDAFQRRSARRGQRR